MDKKTAYIRKNILLDWLYKQGREIEVSELQKFIYELSQKKDVINTKNAE
jgi:hypothetical protein